MIRGGIVRLFAGCAQVVSRALQSSVCVVIRSLELLTKLQADFPQETAPSLLKAYTLIATNKVDEGIEIAESLKSHPEALAAANFLIAAAEMRKNNPEAAATELAEAEARSPDHGLIKLLQGN